jgi:purine-cytosine permease-like protein
MDFRRLVQGWSALVALVVGFRATIPFMDTSLVGGPISKVMGSADISFCVGFVVGAVVYFVRLYFVRRPGLEPGTC